MHCDKCNVDFSEGLRYCKWCGEALVDHPRVTSELHTCPSCAVVVKPGWAFCKSCGERLNAPAGEGAPVACPECGAKLEPDARNCPRCAEDLTAKREIQIAQSPSDTVVIARCEACGELIEAGTLYCKACGSAVYTQETPFGDSALLCGACNSYSPVGSLECRVCGVPFARASRTVVDRPAFVHQPPDSDKGILAQSEAGPDESQSSSGASTAVFGESEHDDQSMASARRSVETSVLPGTAGSKSEQQTSVMQMGRITGPVEEREATHEEPASSGSLEQVTAVDEDKSASKPGGLEAGDRFASPITPSPDARFDQVSQEDILTREIVRPSFPAGQQASVQQPEAAVTREISSAGGADLLFEQAASQPLPGKRNGVLIASAAVAVIVIVAAVLVGYWMLFSRGRARPPAPQVKVDQPTAAPAPPVTPPKPSAPVAPEGMLAVAAGSYTIGRNGADPLEQPRHTVDLPAFFIDRTEVTNAAYKKFVDATGHKPPSNWKGADFPTQHENFPVTGITWQDAADYAAWAGKRLPNEDEWEAAARGTDGRIYPWGNEWRAGLANIGSKPDDITAEQYPSGIKEAGQYAQGASPAGAVDMIGNAWEWVADVMATYPGNTEAKLTLKPGVDYRVIRGGAYDGNKSHDATYRGYLDANQAYPKVGFRCAKDAK